MSIFRTTQCNRDDRSDRRLHLLSLNAQKSAHGRTFDVKRINAWQPLNLADCVADLLYLPEALYCIGLAVVMLGGPGSWSLDAVIATRLST